MSSANPASTKKPLKFQPKNAARRSKEEREALERAEAERRSIRLEAAAADAAAEAARRKAQYGILPDMRGRGRGWRGGRDPRISFRAHRGGRGGFMGQAVPAGLPTTQPPHAGTGIEAPGKPKRRQAGPATRGGTKPKGRKATVIKEDEDEEPVRLSLPDIKMEPNEIAEMSSDTDDDALGPRRNIEEINLITDDELSEGAVEGSTERDFLAARRRRAEGLLPVRLRRKTHVDRVVGVDMASNSATSVEIKKHEEDVAVEVQRAEILATSRKGKGKGKVRGKAVEYMGESRVWKGVYEDEDDYAANVEIKQEPADDDYMEVETAAEPDAPLGTNPTAVPDLGINDDAPSDDKDKDRVKVRIRKGHHFNNLDFQTSEEKLEWQILQDDLRILRDELGRIQLRAAPDSRDGGAAASDDDQDRSEQREGVVYLFQFPPIMPSLYAPSIKTEPGSAESHAEALAESGSAPREAGSVDTKPIKVEDDELPSGSASSRAKLLKVSMAPGKAGKLRIHESGRATISWGETSFEMKLGQTPSFLQSTVLTKMRPKKDVNEYAGEALSFGQIRGKLIVTPDWNEILA